MEVSFINVLITAISLLLLAIPGFLLVKFKLLDKSCDSALSSVVLYGCQPLLMFVGFQKTAFDTRIAVNMIIVAVLSFAIHFLMIAIMYILHGAKNGGATMNSLRFASVFGNCGYMGLPFLQGLFGGTAFEGEILIYASVVTATFNIMSWSIGVYMITGNKKDVSFKRALLNPTVIGIVVGLIVFLTVKTPLVDLAEDGSATDILLTKLMQSFDYLANTVTPLAMIVVGVRIAGVKAKELFGNKYSYLASFYKLILMSLITVLAVAFLPVDMTIKYALFFTLSMPSATATVLFAVRFGGDGDSASCHVLLTTVLAIITIPLMYLVFQLAVGV